MLVPQSPARQNYFAPARNALGTPNCQLHRSISSCTRPDQCMARIPACRNALNTDARKPTRTP
eukprot:7499749-Lingulodinium_polyedra.AAC.1